MNEQLARTMKLRPGIPVTRHTPQPEVVIPAEVTELPLLDAKTPDELKVQEHWLARVMVFDLSNEDQLKTYQEVWQMVCDGKGRVIENKTEFVPASGKYIAFLRWAEFKYKVPSST